ncbi:hypothetical protein RFI_33291, partial [Reticulomyxa filosa]
FLKKKKKKKKMTTPTTKHLNYRNLFFYFILFFFFDIVPKRKKKRKRALMLVDVEDNTVRWHLCIVVFLHIQSDVIDQLTNSSVTQLFAIDCFHKFLRRESNETHICTCTHNISNLSNFVDCLALDRQKKKKKKKKK